MILEPLLNPRFWLPLVMNYCLIAVVGYLNHTLSATGVSIFLVGVLPLFLALDLTGFSGFFGCVFSGLLLDAISPAFFGMYGLSFGGIFVAIQFFRGRLHRGNTGQFIFLAQAVNVFCFILFSLGDATLIQEIWVQLVVNLFLSTVVLTLVAPWYLDLQKSTLRLAFGIQIFKEDLR